MAVNQVVAVYDSALDAFSRPFFVPTTQIAVRSFTDEVNRASPDNPMAKHPDDFVLYLVGLWDDVTGLFENQPGGRVQLVRAKDVYRGSGE